MNNTACLPIIFFFLFAIQSVSLPQQNDSLFILEPEKYIAKEIFNHRITMFGEEIQHNNPITFHNLTCVLNDWLLKLKEDENLNPNLTIVLEFDTETCSLMDNYVKTGNIRPLLDFVAPVFPLELLEQLYEYKKIYEEIKQINETRKQKINFCIKGFEEIGYNVKESYFNMNQEENELWFINERDRYTSSGIIKYLKENPEQKALIFYGSAHLQTGIVNKRLGGFSIPDEQCTGKWIAQYLIDEFGEKDVNIVVSASLDNYALSRPQFDKIDSLPFLLMKPMTEFPSLNLKGVNKYLVNKYQNAPMHELNFAMSRFIIEKSIERTGVFEKFNGYKAGSGKISLYYLNFVYNKKFNTSDDIKKWFEGKEFIGFEIFDSLSYYNYFFTYYLKTSDWYGGKNMLQQLGFYPTINDYRSTSKKEWDEKIWPANLKNIKFINAVEIFWVGYPDEQKAAKEYLKEFSGKDFGEPAEYLKWWRKEYLKFKY
jgi:hypothetical protein